MKTACCLFDISNFITLGTRINPRLMRKTENRYVQTVPDRKYQCPDFREFKIFRAFAVRSIIPLSRNSFIPNQNLRSPKLKSYLLSHDERKKRGARRNNDNETKLFLKCTNTYF